MLYSPPPSDGGGGERCEPVGALAADVTFSRWRCADRSRRPFHHASHGPPPPLWQGRLGFVRSVPLRGCGFEMRMLAMVAHVINIVSVPLRGCGFEIGRVSACKSVEGSVSVPLRGCALFASPVGRGGWRAVRAGRGACSRCDFLTIEMRGSFKAPLPPCFAWSPSPAAAGEAGVRTFRPLAGMWF